MAKLKFEECENCKDWNGNRLHCANICEKPYDAWNEFNRLKDLEEQGLLIRLPCKIGDDIWLIWDCIDFDTGILERKVIKEKFQITPTEEFGKTVFLTKAEAEAALERMGE